MTTVLVKGYLAFLSRHESWCLLKKYFSSIFKNEEAENRLYFFYKPVVHVVPVLVKAELCLPAVSPPPAAAPVLLDL